MAGRKNYKKPSKERKLLHFRISSLNDCQREYVLETLRRTDNSPTLAIKRIINQAIKYKKLSKVQEKLSSSKEEMEILPNSSYVNNIESSKKEFGEIPTIKGNTENICNYGSPQNVKGIIMIYCDNHNKKNLSRDKIIPLNVCNKCFSRREWSQKQRAKGREKKEETDQYAMPPLRMLTQSEVKKLSNTEYKRYAEWRNRPLKQREVSTRVS